MKEPTAPSGPAGVRARFEASLPFALDAFQSEALDAIDGGASVVVAAPTGSGKTVVAEYAVDKALAEGRRVFYTAPIKALSNQKYHDLIDRHGPGRVGLLTGDNSVNESAPVVVMTTEVLRNMIYARAAALRELRYVVLDEVHYLQDPFRGPVWEEVIIHTPMEVDLVCLSATVSNAAELADWVTTVRGRTVAVIHDRRPIELTHLYLVGDRHSSAVKMVHTFSDGRANREGSRYDQVDGDGFRRGRAVATPRRVDIIEALRDEDMLPAITFVFSRAGCDEAVRSCRAAGLRLTSPAERREIDHIVQRHVEDLSDRDLDALDFDAFASALENGYAAHHAGMVPPFKEAVEACFTEGLVKAVFATETLAVGINMPARTVVIEKLTKFGGERHAMLTPGEFTQLTGRAGRRGIDPVGYAATLWNPFIPFEEVAALASHRTYELRSAFRPTNNMAVNLVRRCSRPEAHHLLSLSLAQFQVDRDLVRFHKRADDLRAELRSAEEYATCELGDVSEYLRRRERRSLRPPAADDAIADALTRLRPGDVLAPVNGAGEIVEANAKARSGDGWLVVLANAQRRGRGPTLRAVGPGGKLLSLTSRDFRSMPHVHANIRLPEPFNPNSRSFVSAASGSLQKTMQRAGVSRAGVRRSGTGGATPAGISDAPDGHPVSGCPDLDGHIRALRRVDMLRPEIERLERSAASRSQSLRDEFDRVTAQLEELGYLDGWTVTPAGDLLAGLFHESDLLIAECVREGVFDGLTPPQVAGLASVFVYEERGPGARRGPGQDRTRDGDLPIGFPKALASRWRTINRIGDQLREDSRHYQLPFSGSLDAGFVGLALRWAMGTALDVVLDDAAANGGLAGGDFVRTVRALIDLTRQIAIVAPLEPTRAAARAASDQLFRGVVAASSIADRQRPSETSGPSEPTDPIPV